MASRISKIYKSIDKKVGGILPGGVPKKSSGSSSSNQSTPQYTPAPQMSQAPPPKIQYTPAPTQSKNTSKSSGGRSSGGGSSSVEQQFSSTPQSFKPEEVMSIAPQYTPAPSKNIATQLTSGGSKPSGAIVGMNEGYAYNVEPSLGSKIKESLKAAKDIQQVQYGGVGAFGRYVKGITSPFGKEVVDETYFSSPSYTSGGFRQQQSGTIIQGQIAPPVPRTLIGAKQTSEILQGVPTNLAGLPDKVKLDILGTQTEKKVIDSYTKSLEASQQSITQEQADKELKELFNKEFQPKATNLLEASQRASGAISIYNPVETGLKYGSVAAQVGLSLTPSGAAALVGYYFLEGSKKVQVGIFDKTLTSGQRAKTIGMGVFDIGIGSLSGGQSRTLFSTKNVKSQLRELERQPLRIEGEELYRNELGSYFKISGSRSTGVASQEVDFLMPTFVNKKGDVFALSESGQKVLIEKGSEVPSFFLKRGKASTRIYDEITGKTFKSNIEFTGGGRFPTLGKEGFRYTKNKVTQQFEGDIQTGFGSGYLNIKGEEYVNLYHGTTAKNALRIKEKGLVPSGKYKEVYLTTDEELAKGFAGRSSAAAGFKSPAEVIEVNLPKNVYESSLVNRKVGVGGVDEITLNKVSSKYINNKVPIKTEIETFKIFGASTEREGFYNVLGGRPSKLRLGEQSSVRGKAGTIGKIKAYEVPEESLSTSFTNFNKPTQALKQTTSFQPVQVPSVVEKVSAKATQSFKQTAIPKPSVTIRSSSLYAGRGQYEQTQTQEVFQSNIIAPRPSTLDLSSTRTNQFIFTPQVSYLSQTQEQTPLARGRQGTIQINRGSQEFRTGQVNLQVPIQDTPQTQRTRLTQRTITPTPVPTFTPNFPPITTIPYIPIPPSFKFSESSFFRSPRQRKPKYKYQASFTAGILGIKIGKAPKELKIGGYSGFGIRGIVSPSRKKRKRK